MKLESGMVERRTLDNWIAGRRVMDNSRMMLDKGLDGSGKLDKGMFGSRT
jgi:hypothetical protein